MVINLSMWQYAVLAMRTEIIEKFFQKLYQVK